MENIKEFLENDFRQRKSLNPNYSLRSYAKKLNISPAQLSQILSSKRKITLKTSQKLIQNLDLSPKESEKFISVYFTKKNTNKNITSTTNLEEDVFRLISDWYHFAILSLTKTKNAKSNSRWISARLGISIEQASIALRRLEKLGIITTTPKFEQICDPLEVITQVPSKSIRNYHKQCLKKAYEMIDSVDITHREYQALTFALNPKDVAIFKSKIDDFLNEVGSLSNNSNATEVYNLNVQLYPISKISQELI